MCKDDFKTTEDEAVKQVSNLVFSKELKKFGYKQKGLFYWRVIDEHRNLDILKDEVTYELCYGFGDIVAPTVAELGEVLRLYMIKEGVPEYFIKPFEDGWIFRKPKFKFSSEDTKLRKPGESMYCISNTEADARAQYFLYLKKNNLMI